MQLRRQTTNRASQTIAFLVAASTICCWTSVMGALAAKGIDHSLLDGVTCAAVVALGGAGALSAAVRKRNKQAPSCLDEKHLQELSAGANHAAGTTCTAPNAESLPAEPPLNPTEQACLALAQAHNLSLREREVLNLMATGITGKEIAIALTLSYNTVKSHIRHIYDKLDVHRKQDLVDLIEQQKERLA